MKIHKTKGIVLKTVKYGESSLITTIYTELFGLQTYIVKGVRQTSSKSNNKIAFFQPAAILDLQVYHNELKNIQFVKEFQWASIYSSIFSDVVKYAVAMYIVELFLHSVKQPESNAPLFYFLEEILLHNDREENHAVANIPVYYALNLCKELGFQISGNYSAKYCFLDLKEGLFVAEMPLHADFFEGYSTEIIDKINQIYSLNSLQELKINKETRRGVLQIIHRFFDLHVTGFGELKSYTVLQNILS